MSSVKVTENRIELSKAKVYISLQWGLYCIMYDKLLELQDDLFF